VLERRGIAFATNAGDGAFYGPKIDFCILDAMRREWQLGTVQLDFSLPERFDLSFVSNEGRDERVVMIHRALLGSIERFMAILIEHCGGDLPLWLAPVQARLITVTDDQHGYATETLAALRAAGLRAEADLRGEKLGFKIREAEMQKVPIVLVIGEKEVTSGTVSPRRRGKGNQPAAGVDDFIRAIEVELRPRSAGGVS
jgi:threonyl-tRNA synthetase